MKIAAQLTIEGIAVADITEKRIGRAVCRDRQTRQCVLIADDVDTLARTEVADVGACLGVCCRWRTATWRSDSATVSSAAICCSAVSSITICGATVS